MSIDRSCKASVICIRNLREICKMWKSTFHLVVDAVIDTKIMNHKTHKTLRCMYEQEYVVKFENRPDYLENELLDKGQSIKDYEKQQIHFHEMLEDFEDIVAKVVGMSGKIFTKAVSHLIFEEYSQKQEESKGTCIGHRRKRKAGEQWKMFLCDKKCHIARNFHSIKKYYYCKKRGYLIKDC